jgi:Glyoxalase-like domain
MQATRTSIRDLGTFALILLTAATVPATAQSRIELDHVWIMVSPNAPEREAVQRAGFQISPDMNRHDGQGTASITVEFENSYLELMWPDSTVTVAPGLERAAEKFRQRMLWRSSGWCPIGVGLRRTTPSNDALPFPTWSWTAEWMPKGTKMEMLTPRDDTRSPALFIEPRALTDTSEQAARASRYHHPIGTRHITAIRLISPKTYERIAALKYLQTEYVLSVTQGDQWLLELTFEGGKRKKSKDLRPDLPVVIRY